LISDYHFNQFWSYAPVYFKAENSGVRVLCTHSSIFFSIYHFSKTNHSIWL